MAFSLYDASVANYLQILGGVSGVLDRSLAHFREHNVDPETIVEARLAPDMLPLTRQVQIACDIAKNSVARLAAQEPPRFEDNETSFEQLRLRIARVIDYLKSIPAAALDGSEARDIRVPTGQRAYEFKGLEFLQRWAIPNVFFHVTAAYAILRHNGVEIGKRDFLGALREV